MYTSLALPYLYWFHAKYLDNLVGNRVVTMSYWYSQQQKYRHDQRAKTIIIYARSYCLNVTDIIIVYTYFWYFDCLYLSEDFFYSSRSLTPIKFRHFDFLKKINLHTYIRVINVTIILGCSRAKKHTGYVTILFAY